MIIDPWHIAKTITVPAIVKKYRLRQGFTSYRTMAHDMCCMVNEAGISISAQTLYFWAKGRHLPSANTVVLFKEFGTGWVKDMMEEIDQVLKGIRNVDDF